MVALSPEWTVVEWAAGCTACGSSTKCPKWIVTGTLSCEPYPCLCKQTRQQAYEEHGIEDASCWWRDKKRAGRLASRCPCWGRVRDDSLPQDCCSRHEANPQYVTPDPATTSLGDNRLLGGAGEDEPADTPPNAERPGEAPHHTGTGVSRQRTPADPMASYTRLWPPSEVTCGCPTPWDGQKIPGGVHCSQCHCNWKNVSVMVTHQRRVVDTCRLPDSIVDCDTGRPLLFAQRVGGFLVWGFRFS
jgi:hypothetical protein